MAWKFNNDIPIYLQIMEEFKLQIAQGIYKPGDKIPAVRELAITVGVNPNTMQKALSELEREGVLCSNRTAGRYVSEDVNNKQDLNASLKRKYVEEYVASMKKLGCTKEDIMKTVEDYLEE